MKTLTLFFVLISCIGVVVLLNPSTGFAQGRQRFHIEGYSVKTDALRLLKTAITKSESYSISGEIYFNNEYSFNVDLGMETEGNSGLKRTQKEFIGQFRWYFNQDDCSCSALFGGIYFANMSIRQTVDQWHIHNYAVNYNLSAFEGGLCAGYQAIFLSHFVIDPALEAGLALHQNIQSTEQVNEFSAGQEKGLLLRIHLGIGYRF